VLQIIWNSGTPLQTSSKFAKSCLWGSGDWIKCTRKLPAFFLTSACESTIISKIFQRKHSKDSGLETPGRATE
uniref:Uncharacterized protein n=1 Tax=Chlorocebus sabaeus TaxID=60711 RepID=A0A0D9SE32_CHLSB